MSHLGVGTSLFPAWAKHGAAPSSLLSGLVSYWSLEGKVGATWPDVVGTNHLTESATPPTTAAGIHNLAATFTAASSEYFSLPDSAALLPSAVTGKTWAAWVKPTLAGNEGLFGSPGNGVAYVNGAGTLVTYWYDTNGANFSEVDLAGVVANVWQFIVIWYDPADKKMHASLNDGAPSVGSALPSGPRQLNPVCGIGAIDGTGSFPFDGLMDEVAVWSRVLISGERTALYAAGAGKFYPY